jgi:hypothetical protein
MQPGAAARSLEQTDSPSGNPEETAMKSHRRRRVAALVLAGSCALAAPAGAVPADVHQQPVSAKIGDTPADYYAQPVAPAPKIGDTPVDDPGA